MLFPKMRRNALIVVIFSLLGLIAGKTVRVTELNVPPTAVFGESVTLMCTYELGKEELYVVKWYKDDLEFYRYEPKDKNQSVYFPQPGIDIDLSRSGSNSVFLRNVALDSAGKYKCQVSTDAPTYSCVQAVKEMNVVILPNEGPTISGGESTYEFGENVTLNCTSAKSKPAASLGWWMNDELVNDKESTDYGVTVYPDQLESSTTTLHFMVKEDLFRKGKIDIKCVASFYDRVTMISKDIRLQEIDSAVAPSLRFLLLLVSLFITLWPGFR